VSLCRCKLPLVLAAGVVLYQGWFVAAVAQSALPATVPASVNAIALTVTPNPAKVKGKITLTLRSQPARKQRPEAPSLFFDGKLSLGSAQVVGRKPAKEYKTGTAILTTIVSPGFHAVTAVYGGTAVSPKVVRSKPVALKITARTVVGRYSGRLRIRKAVLLDHVGTGLVPAAHRTHARRSPEGPLRDCGGRDRRHSDLRHQ
jgi:hypothetical protein